MDREAAERGTTVYLVDRRIDMLPSLLGSGLFFGCVGSWWGSLSFYRQICAPSKVMLTDWPSLASGK